MNIRYWLLGLALLSACSQTPHTPESAYQAFFKALADSDRDKAISFLSKETLAAFSRVGQRLSDAIDGAGDPLDFFLQGVQTELMTPLREVRVVSQQENRATLKVKAGPCGQNERCSESEVMMHREDGRWVVAPALPKQLQTRSP